jgi:hypothetical protein
MKKKQIFFSFVLATLSFIAARSIQEVGAEHFYTLKASSFDKEDGFYNWHAPFNSMELPLGLSSIKNICLLDSARFVAIDQQSGSVVLLDESTGKLVGQLNLSPAFQFYSLAVYDSILVLQDQLDQLHFLSSPYDSTSEIGLNELSSDLKFKSFCSHPITKRLFFLGNDFDKGDGRYSNYVYGFGLGNRKLREKPLFEIESEKVEQFALQMGIVPHEDLSNSSIGLQTFYFKPSALAVHPKTNEIYVLSQETAQMAVFSQFGEVVNFIPLSRSLANHPTDIQFHPNGDLIVINNHSFSSSIVRLPWNKIKNHTPQNALIHTF